MMQRWGPDAVRFMCDASEYGTYHQALIAELLPYLPQNGHICDAGCGLGYLSEQLAKHCRKVTALDRSEAALTHLRKRSAAENLHIVCDDIFSVSSQFDAMVFCYFGKTNEILHLSRKLCKGNVLIIKRECSEHRFSIGAVPNRNHRVESTSDVLRQFNVPFESKQITLELGQPFRNIEEAMCFFRLYNKSTEPVEEIAVRNLLIEIQDNEFSLYLPSVRTMELIVFSAKDLPKGCETL